MTGRAATALAATLALAAPAAALAQEAPADPESVAMTAASGQPSGGGEQAGGGEQGRQQRADRDAGSGEQAPRPRKRTGGRIGIRIRRGVYRLGRTTLTVPGREVRLKGRIVPFVPGQRVMIRVWNGRRLAKRAVVRPRPSRTRKTATFGLRFTARDPGRVRVFATHQRSPEQRRLVSRPATLDIVAPVAGFGTRSPFVGLLQQRLAKLGYAVPRSGVYDGGTGRAIEAYRKVNGMARLQSLDRAVVDKLLRGKGGFKVRYPQHGRHVEAHLGKQVLALIENGRVYRAYTTSSGTSATPTVLGTYRFYWKQPGVNNREMVHSSYFIRGYAIHGYKSVPTYPASHGCLRVPIPDARFIYDWVRLGDQIDVYY